MLVVLACQIAFAGDFEDGVSALRDGRAADAETLFLAAVADDPQRVEAWWELGWSHWARDEFAEAIEAWLQVQRLQPDHRQVPRWLAAAQTRQMLGQIEVGAIDVPMESFGRSIRFAAAGDTMLGSDLRRGEAGLAPGDGSMLFTDVADIFATADVAFLNLEGTLADGLPSTKCGPDSTNCYAFRTPTRYAQALVSASIDVVSNANNHAMDLGEPGMVSTLAALDAVGVAHSSRYGDVAKLDIDGIVVAVVSAHSGSCCLNVNRIEEVQGAIVQADEDADIVVLSFHGGREGASARHVPGQVEIAWGERRGDVKALSRAAIDAGADLVIGHGPHVLRAMEVYRGRLIAYSLGNFCGYKQFGTQGGHGGTSLVLDVELAQNGVLTGARIHPMLLDSTGIPRPDPDGAAVEAIRELSLADFPDSGVRVDDLGVLSW